MKPLINIINQVFEIEKKLGTDGASPVARNLERIRNELSEMGYNWYVPLAEKFDETRTDCEASIVGALKKGMTITEVIKPVVQKKQDGNLVIVQKGIVVVE